MKAPTLVGVAVVIVAVLHAVPGLAVPAGKAVGTVTVDGKAVALGFAARGNKPNLFDESKQDTVIVLSDRALGETAPDDDVGLAVEARSGTLTSLALRLDGAKLVNVAVNSLRLDGTALLPGAWFSYVPGSAGSGTLKLASRSTDGHSYACTVEFAAAPAAARRPTEPAATAIATPPPTPTLPPSSTSTIEPKAMAAMLVAAMMNKDEDQALKLVASGADPNLRDQYGVPMLNWSVMMCMPRLVKALVARGADLKYERSPGLTILQEAGACPEAATILRAAGAR
jgi:hypothetical protein